MLVVQATQGILLPMKRRYYRVPRIHSRVQFHRWGNAWYLPRRLYWEHTGQWWRVVSEMCHPVYLPADSRPGNNAISCKCNVHSFKNPRWYTSGTAKLGTAVPEKAWGHAWATLRPALVAQWFRCARLSCADVFNKVEKNSLEFAYVTSQTKCEPYDNTNIIFLYYLFWKVSYIFLPHLSFYKETFQSSF